VYDLGLYVPNLLNLGRGAGFGINGIVINLLPFYIFLLLYLIL